MDYIDTFSEFINNNQTNDVCNADLILEHLNDLKPIICIIIGGPGAGKTYWMQHKADSFLWQQFKQLDIDHTMQKYQLETCNEVAMELISSLSDYEVCVNGTKQNFEKVKQEIQKSLNERTDKVGSFGMYINIMDIETESKIGNITLWEWAKRMDKIDKDDKLDEFLIDFKSAFYRTYFKSIFASDFSKRDFASAEYDKNLYTKLGNDIINNNNSTCIAITGKSKGDIEWIINAVKHTDSVVSIVFIDTPMENAIQYDKQRDRTVGENLIRNIMEQISNTWDVLKQDYENMGIWKMFHLKPLKTKIDGGKVTRYKTCETFTNKTMLYKNLNAV